MHDLRRRVGGCAEWLRRGQHGDQIAATGHPLARDEAVLLRVGIQRAVGPASAHWRFATQPAHNLADFALRAEADRELDLLIRDRLRLSRRELAPQIGQHVVHAARHPGGCTGAWFMVRCHWLTPRGLKERQPNAFAARAAVLRVQAMPAVRGRRKRRSGARIRQRFRRRSDGRPWRGGCKSPALARCAQRRRCTL